MCKLFNFSIGILPLLSSVLPHNSQTLDFPFPYKTVHCNIPNNDPAAAPAQPACASAKRKVL